VKRGRRIVIAALGVTLLGLAPATAQAELLDASCPGPTNGGSSATEAQTFTAVHTGTLLRGEMFVAKTAGAGFQMQILNAGPSGPTGNALATTSVPDSSVANVPSPGPASPSAPIDATFSPGVSVTAGQQYAILVTRPGSSFVSKDRNNAGCPGNEFNGTVGGSWMLRDPTYDFPFSTFVNPINAFTIGKVKGTKVSLTLPGPGGVDLAKTKRIKPSHTDFTSGGQVTVRVHLTKLGKGVLGAGGKVKAAITYTPTGGDPDTLTRKLKRK
jgi:hypothetical protein